MNLYGRRALLYTVRVSSSDEQVRASIWSREGKLPRRRSRDEYEIYCCRLARRGLRPVRPKRLAYRAISPPTEG